MIITKLHTHKALQRFLKTTLVGLVAVTLTTSLFTVRVSADSVDEVWFVPGDTAPSTYADANGRKEDPKVSKRYYMVIVRPRRGDTNITTGTGEHLIKANMSVHADKLSNEPDNSRDWFLANNIDFTYLSGSNPPSWVSTGQVGPITAGSGDQLDIDVYLTSGAYIASRDREVHDNTDCAFEDDDGSSSCDNENIINDLCCYHDSKCAGLRGSESKCNKYKECIDRYRGSSAAVAVAACSASTGSEGFYSGICQTGKRCQLGGIIETNNQCDINQNQNKCRARNGPEINVNRCIPFADSGTNKCAEGPCNDLVLKEDKIACLKARYGNDIFTQAVSHTMDEVCDSDSQVTEAGMLSFIENPWGQAELGGVCGEGICQAYWTNLNGRPFTMCFGTAAPTTCTEYSCEMQATVNTSNEVTVTVNKLCMPPTYYQGGVELSTSFDVIALEFATDTEFKRQTIVMTSDPGAQTVSMGTVDVQGRSNVALVLRSNQDPEVSPCMFAGLNFNGAGGDGGTDTTDTDPGSASNDFGIKNCPYQPPADAICPAGAPSFVCDSIRASAERRSADQIAEYDSCAACIGAKGTYTAFGCWNTTVAGIFTNLVRIALGVMGGVVLLRMIYLGYIYQTGDTKKIAEARSGVISTMAGIIVIIFSVVILRVIGVNVLDIVPSGFFG